MKLTKQATNNITYFLTSTLTSIQTVRSQRDNGIPNWGILCFEKTAIFLRK